MTVQLKAPDHETEVTDKLVLQTDGCVARRPDRPLLPVPVASLLARELC